MAKFLLALLALIPAFASAQTLSAPPDVGTFTAQAATYASGSTPNVLGDGSNAKGGTAPAFSTYPEGTDPSPTVPTGYIVSGGGGCALSNPVVSPCIEKKVRFLAESVAFRFDDPIRFFGQPGVSHCHEFFGYLYPSARSTRVAIRTRIGSAASGGPANDTVYWEPCWTKTISAKKYAMPAITNVIYYSVPAPNGSTLVDDLQPLHLRLRFITGRNMDDPDDAVVKGEILTANLQSGTTGRYVYKSNGFLGYQCNTSGINGSTITVVNGAGAGTAFSPYFVAPGGVDPWGGNCTDGYAIIAVADAPECWDGVNLSSPTGYRHFRHLVQDSTLGIDTCPNGWYKVPSFEIKTAHQTHGFSDYGTWALDSDAGMSAKLTALGTPRTVQPGESFHNDWMNGWNQGTLNTWLADCLGIGTNAPHTCNTDTISSTAGTQLISGTNSPDGKRSPQVNSSKTVDTNDITQLFLIATSRTGTHNMRGM